MIVLHASAKVGHRQTTYSKKAALLNQDVRLFYVYPIPTDARWADEGGEDLRTPAGVRGASRGRRGDFERFLRTAMTRFMAQCVDSETVGCDAPE